LYNYTLQLYSQCTATVVGIVTAAPAHSWSNVCLCLRQNTLSHWGHTNGISSLRWQPLWVHRLALFFLGAAITSSLHPLRMCLSTRSLTDCSLLDLVIIWLQIGQMGTRLWERN